MLRIIYFVLNAAENYVVFLKLKKEIPVSVVTSHIIMCFTSVYSCTSLVIVVCITSS